MGEYRVSTGRGGAGNMITSNEKPSPKVVTQGSQTPNILSPIYSTGRGGAGNMRRNVDPVMTRTAQDVDNDDVIDVTSSNNTGTIKKIKSRRFSEPPKTISIGRGGAGNILSPKSSRKKRDEKGSKSSSTGDNGSSHVDEKSSKSGFFTKLKSLFK
ncbi:Par32 [Kluyveromyces lactis]|nr:Par32 [Kluyveromyces lactis]